MKKTFLMTKKFLKIKFLVFFVFFMIISSCKKPNKNECDNQAYIIYQGIPNCEFLIFTNNEIFEPININEYINFINFTDTQQVTISILQTNQPVVCAGVDRVQILCMGIY
jgi:hypothetical protein